MMKISTLEELKKALGVDDLVHLSKDNVIDFLKIMPNVERPLAISVLRALDNKREIALNVIKHLNIMCEEAISNNYDLDSIRGYQHTLDALEYMIRDHGASFEDLEYSRSEIIKLSSKLKIDDEGFIDALIEACGGPIALVLVIGVALFSSYK